MNILDYIEKMKDMYEGPRITAQEPRTMAQGGRIGFGDGGITLVKNKSKNVVGENFKNSPQIFKTAQNELNDRILNWGYLNSREDYFKTLNQSDILPVTSIHDFFGISTVEAMGYNVFPLLPNRLAYPEHIPPKLKTNCIYESDEDLYLKLKKYLENGIPDNFSEIQNHIFQYEMSSVINKYDEFFEKSI